GTGRKTAVKSFLEELATTKPIPSDWCYVNNFQNPYEPKAIELPSGRGLEFQSDIKSFIEETRRLLPKAFDKTLDITLKLKSSAGWKFYCFWLIGILKIVDVAPIRGNGLGCG
ncbi:AAA family ATPase, partial [Candidatus Bathyarchaeota archaeon]|nr:AAA family ATPase [Candidatus Bathyarchaeota archaeon]